MIGNPEPNDIRPAVALGMRAIRVAIEEPPPTSIDAADAIATDLEAVLTTVSSWVGAGGMIA
jgi:FMN phosphatase YigB (HAD superfamily)